MDQTDCFKLPFPECAPPLTKDASDIEQFEDLAFAVDAAVQTLDDTIEERLRNPDAGRMSGGITTAGNLVTIPHAVREFDNTPGDSITNLTLDAIVIAQNGWYLVGGHVSSTHAQAAGIGMRVQLLVNGSAPDGRQGPGRPTFAGASATDDVGWLYSLHLSAGDVLGVQINHGASAALSITYASEIWVFQVLANV